MIMKSDSLLDFALSMYASEPCRICGEILSREDVRTAVFAGYSENNEARAAHNDCWEKYPAVNQMPRSEWVYQ
jgi:hypothetical protein